MSYMIIAYPSPIAERAEYMPLWIIYAIGVIALYMLMYQMVKNSMNIYNEHNEKILLETKIELQKSQLELKDVYYKMAYIDSLTGLKNRSAFDKKKGELLKYCIDGMFTCVSMDLNNLKTTNDNYGHEAGDNLIKNFGSLMKETFKDFDDIYRVGGDEFILIFEGRDELAVRKKINELKNNIEKNNDINRTNLSVAFGIAECVLGICSDIKTIDSVLSLADQFMYENKKQMKS